MLLNRDGWGGQGRAGGEKYSADMRTKLLCITIYCVKPRPDIGSQFGSWSHRVLWRKSMWIMCEYDLATANTIHKLTQPCTCEMVSSVFSAMSRLKFFVT